MSDYGKHLLNKIAYNRTSFFEIHMYCLTVQNTKATTRGPAGAPGWATADAGAPAGDRASVCDIAVFALCIHICNIGPDWGRVYNQTKPKNPTEKNS